MPTIAVSAGRTPGCRTARQAPSAACLARTSRDWGSSFAGIPAFAPGQTPQISDFSRSSGKANLCSIDVNGNGTSLVSGDETLALHATAEHKLARSWSAFGELTLAKEHALAREIGLTLTDVTVPASNAFNPFGEDVNVTTVLGPENGLQGLSRLTRFTRALAGIRGELGGDWETEFTWSTVRDNGGTKTYSENLDSVALDAALAASTINPFATGKAAADTVLRSIWSDTDRTSKGRKDQVGALARGSVLQLPAGALETVIGMESARDHYDVSIPAQAYDVHDGRHNSAAYGELRAPLLKANPADGGGSLATLTFAARRDRYSDFGSANTSQSGLELRPLRSLLLRASTAASFQAAHAGADKRWQLPVSRRTLRACGSATGW